jgi:hypothetical protein
MKAQSLITSAAFVTVEQLNHAQWHAHCPVGTWRSTGVGSYVDVVANALWMAAGQGLGVATIDLGHKRTFLQWPEVIA